MRKNTPAISVLLATVALAFMACDQHSDANARVEKIGDEPRREVTVTGEVFIRTKGGNSISLGAVEVRAYSVEALHMWAQQKCSELVSKLHQLPYAYARLEYERKATRNVVSDALSAITPVATARTSSGGLYAIEVPASLGAVLLVAETERLTGMGRETLAWVERLPDQSRQLHAEVLRLDLNNTNVANSVDDRKAAGASYIRGFLSRRLTSAASDAGSCNAPVTDAEVAAVEEMNRLSAATWEIIEGSTSGSRR